MKIIAFFLVITSSSISIWAQDSIYNKNHDRHSFALELRYGLMSASGHLTSRVDKITTTSGKSEIDADFPGSGTDATFNYPAIAAGMRLNKYHISFEVNPLNYTAQVVTKDTLHLDSIIVFPGANAAIKSDLGIYSFVFTRDIIEGKRGEFAIGLGVILIDYNLSIAIEDILEEQTISQWLPAPTLALGYAYNTPRWELIARLAGVAVRSQEIEIAYMDVDLAGRYKIFRKEPWIGMITAGIRYLPLYTSADYNSPDYGPIYISSSSVYVGPYLGLRFEFVGDYMKVKK